MRRFTPLENTLSFFVGIVIAVPICIMAVTSRNAAMVDAIPQVTRQYFNFRDVEKAVEVEVPVVVHDVVYISDTHRLYETPFTQNDLNMLALLVHYEAGNQDELGKRLVADTVLNRIRSTVFPNTMEEVIFQHNGGSYQYAVAGAGLINGTASESDLQLVYEEVVRQYNTDAIYFQTNTYPASGVQLFKHGAHYFSGLKKED